MSKDVTSDDVAVTVSSEGLVYAVDPATAQLLVFNAELTEGQVYKLADLDAQAPVKIYTWRNTVIVHVAHFMRWDYRRPTL